jgi:DNA polymerase-1
VVVSETGHRTQAASAPGLFLIDGPSLVYRAFFALPESIATSRGVPTNAIFGFASMLVKIVTEYGVCPTVVAWDAGSSGRSEIYADYKAGRRSRPDLLKQQWPAMERLVTALGYRNVHVPGFEADDVIASVSEHARSATPPIPVMIVTGDRDAFQLIDDDGLVAVMATARGITDTKIYDREAVVERYGIPPELIPDYYGLKGDTSDNIPGVPGIGEKTASELIVRFGSLEAVLEHIDDISGAKRKQNLIDHSDDARMSKALATMQRDLPLDLDVSDVVAGEPDRSGLIEIFREYELRAPLQRLEEALRDRDVGVGGAPGDGDAPGTQAEPQAEVRSRTGSVADVTRLPEGELCVAVAPADVPDGALFGDGPQWRFAVAVAKPGAGAQAGDASAGERGRERVSGVSQKPMARARARAIENGEADNTSTVVLSGQCESPAAVTEACQRRPVVAHDAKAFGVVPAQLVHDTLLGAYLLDPARRGYPLDELCQEHGFAQARAGTDDDPVAREALGVQALAAWQREQLVELGLDGVMRDIELPLVRVLREMELTGVHLNVALLRRITERVHSELEALERHIHSLAGEEFLISSPSQLAAVLFEKLSLSRKRRGKTGFSTDARVLQAIRSEHEIVPEIERWRELSTLVKTYLDVLPGLVDERSRIHTTFLQAVAQTGRLSSTNPNMQNIPIRTARGREIRECFDAEPGKVLLSVDYSQIELRVLAHVAQDPVLIEIFRRGEDVHTATASEVFGVAADEIDPGMRSKAKMINYGIVYGLSDFGLADRLNIPRAEAKEFIDAYLARFERVAEFMALTIAQATADGHVRTLWGRWRQIPELQSPNHQVRSAGERLAVNTVIQGTAADIIKLAMVRCHGALADKSLATRLVLTIHDELLFEGPPEEIGAVTDGGEHGGAHDAAPKTEVVAMIEREMVGVWAHDPPLEVDVGIGRNWLQAK